MKFEVEKQNKGCDFPFCLSGNRSVLFQNKLGASLKYDNLKKKKKSVIEENFVSIKGTARKALQNVLFVLKDRLK